MEEVDQLKKAFCSTNLRDALGKVKGVQKQVSIMILSVLFPSFSEKLKEISAVPLECFETSRDVLNFTEAIINSGLAADLEKGLAFVLGNTGVGKSSLVNTLKRFTEKPDENPVPVLSMDNQGLLETRVMEIYDNIAMEHNKDLDVELSETFGKVHLIKFVEEESEDGEMEKAKQKKVKVKLVDMGGHQEYFSCSSLFVACSGVFFVCFDSALLTREDIDDAYYAEVGTFVDLVCQTTRLAGIRPKLALVATKTEQLGNEEDHEGSYQRILETTKDHLAYLSSQNSVFLVDEVLRTSSAKVTSAKLKEFHRKLVTLCSHKSLRFKPVEIRPLLWHNFLLAIQETPSITFKEATQKWATVKSKVGIEQTPKLSPRDLDVLAKLRSILEAMVEKDSSLNENRAMNSQSSNESLSGGKLTMSILRGESQYEPADELSQEVKSILTFFREEGEILWYEETEDDKHPIISRPMDLVKSLRTVINHKVLHNFQGVRFLYTRLDLTQKGILSFKDFKAVFTDQAFTAADTWKLMIQLRLGCPLKTNDQEQILIPCLIDSSLEKKILEVQAELEKDEETVCLQYQFDCNRSTVNMYHKVVEVFAERFLSSKDGGEINFASNQKVERRNLKNVSGLHGSIKWHKEGVRTPHKYKFLILEQQNNHCSMDTETKKPFSIERSIQVYLSPMDNAVDKTIFEILRNLDEHFSPHLGDVQRSISCKECQKSGDIGYFGVKEGLALISETQPCQPNLMHSPNNSFVQLIKENRKPFELETLMQEEKSSLGLQKFGVSQMKEMMMSHTLEAGEQIWVYHDKDTDPWNPVARVNPYAHCLIYIGHRKEGKKEIHEVVHTAMASIGSGVLKATIRREPVLIVKSKPGTLTTVKFGPIKANDHVFPGHKLVSCQFAANIHQMIVDRAVKCSEEPSLVFDYDYK